MYGISSYVAYVELHSVLFIFSKKPINYYKKRTLSFTQSKLIIIKELYLLPKGKSLLNR